MDMANTTVVPAFHENTSSLFDNVTTNKTSNDIDEPPDTKDVMMILETIIASVGIVANFTVVVAFFNHKKLRRKIPNIFIINQVSCKIISNNGIKTDSAIINCDR